jgi:hypothetical protein
MHQSGATDREALGGTVNTYPFDAKHKPGTWKALQNIRKGLSATFACPKCHMVGSLSDHEIAPDGTVTPSVVCPNEACDFHEYIQLEGWENETP